MTTPRPSPQSTGGVPETPAPIQRKGLPTQPTWLLSVLITLAAVTVSLGLCALAGALPAYIPYQVAEGICLCMLILLVVYLFRMCRTGRWVPILLILLSAFLFYSCWSFIPATIVVAALFATGNGALLLATAPRKTMTWLPLIPLIALGLSVPLSSQPLLALACLAPFPAAVALAFGTRSSADISKKDGLTRVGVLCAVSLCAGLAVLGVAAILLSRSLGELSLPALSDWLEGLRLTLSEELMDMYAQLAQMTNSGDLVTEAQALNAINSLFNILPAMVVVVCNLFAALAQVLLFCGLSVFGYADSLKGRVQLFRMSLVSDVVFLLSWVVLLIASLASADASTLPGTVANNIAMILQPGLALCGILRLLRLLMRNRRGGCLPFFLIMILPFLFLYAAGLLAFYEAGAAILGVILARVRPASGGQGGQSGENGSNDNADQSGL